MTNDESRRKADQERAERDALGRRYLAAMDQVRDSIVAGGYVEAGVFAQVASIYLAAWQHGSPPARGPQSAVAPAADHEKHTTQEHTE